MDFGPTVTLTPSRGDPLPSGDSTPTSEHVDVANAKSDFEALRQVLSRKSVDTNKDVEKAVVDEFDLLAYLTDHQQQREAERFENKELGVTWDDLSVSGVGGVRVSLYFPDRGVLPSFFRRIESLFFKC